MNEHTSSISIIESIVLAGVLFVFHAYFVLSSIAISRSKSKRLREYSRAGVPGAKFARIILIRANNYLLACQVGLLSTALIAGFILMRMVLSGELSHIAALLIDPSQSYFYLFYYGSVTAVIMAVVFCALLLVQVSKAIAFSAPERSLAWVALSILFFARLISPLVFLLRRCGKAILRFSGLKFPAERESVVSAEDISEMVELSSEAGEIEQEEKEMIKGVFAFSEKLVRDVMTPRKDVIALSLNASIAEVTEIFANEGLSRVVVYGEDLDDVRGILLVKDMIPYVGKQADDFTISSIMRPASFVPNTKEIGELLQELRLQAQHFAVVMDEHGGLDGVVTVEDLLEEIVGEIFDEYDNPAEHGKAVRRGKTGDLIVDGSVEIEIINEMYHYDFPKGDYNTLAGFVIHTLGRMPEPGELVQYKGLTLRVEKIDFNRIELLRIMNNQARANLQLLENSQKNQPSMALEKVPETPNAGISGSR